MIRSLMVIASVTVVVAGSPPVAAPAETATDAAPAAPKSLPPYAPVIDPARFGHDITNPYFPLTPGTVLIYEGKRDKTPLRIELTVTNETKLIMGVRCVVVRDILTTGTELLEKTTDWYAQDADGNVWYFGEDTAEYKNGAVTSTAGTWMGGVDGALPGIVMQASPKVDEGYRQEYRPGVAEDYATVLQVDAVAQAPAGSYDHVVVTQDIDLLDTTKNERKSYAAGAGFVGSSGMVNGHHEETWLVKVLRPG